MTDGSNYDTYVSSALPIIISNSLCSSETDIERGKSVPREDCDGDGIVCLDLDHNTESLDRGVSSHLTPYTGPVPLVTLCTLDI